jgi:hypothetical protein
MHLASYKSTHPGLPGIFNRAVRWWLSGPYSHSAIVFSDGAVGTSTFATGVTLSTQPLLEPDFDFIKLDGDEPATRAWFEANIGRPYDTLGLFGFVWRRGVESKGKCFCSEACAAALGFSEPHRIDPVLLHLIANQRTYATK